MESPLPREVQNVAQDLQLQLKELLVKRVKITLRLQMSV